MFSTKAQKAQKAQKEVKHTTFFILDVFMHTNIAKSTKSDFLLLRRFMRTKMLSFLFASVRFVFFVPNKRLSSSLMFYARLRLFLFLFAYVLFMFFMLVRFFCEWHKTFPIPSFTILLI